MKCKHPISRLRDVTHSVMRCAGITTSPSRADTGVPLSARTGRRQQNARRFARVYCRVCVTYPPSAIYCRTWHMKQGTQAKLPRAGQVVPLLNSTSCHEGVFGSEVIVPCILNIDDRFTLEPLYPRGGRTLGIHWVRG